MSDFLMPALGADMETGTVVQWLVAPGSRVRRGDVVAVVETHKGAIDVEIFLDGVIDNLVPVGTALRVGERLAQVRGPDAPAQAGTERPAPPPAAAAAGPAAGPTGPARAGIAEPRDAAAGAAPVAAADGPRAGKVSPAARRRAQELGVDAAGLRGTGVDGAVTLADVEAAAAPGRRGRFDPAQMRQAIAAAMSRSKREIPHYYLTQHIDLGPATDWLDRHNGDLPPAERLLPAVLLLKAVARALAGVPQLNGFFDNGAFRAGPGVHVGWAIALRGGGLVAPAIHDADRAPLPELMRALRDLVQRARAGGLRSSELTDATVTVTSLGERGADGVWGVIYPPQVALVGFGRVVQRPWCVDGQVVARPVLTASLAADHRASDGHLGGRLLAAIDDALQHPDRL